MKHLKFSLPTAAACLTLLLATSPVSAASPFKFTSPRPIPTVAPGIVRSCQARVVSIQNRLFSLIRMSSSMLDVFSAHRDESRKHITQKVVVPSGKTVPNYSTLIANIATKKAAVSTAWTKAHTDANSFSCTTGDPKVLLFQFRTDMQNTKDALKAYRTSI